MPFANNLSDRRSRSQRRLPRQNDLHPVREASSGHNGALVLLLPRRAAPKPRILAALSSRAIKTTAMAFHWGATALADLLFAVSSWVIAEFLAGCANYACAMYALPPLETAVPVPVEPSASRDVPQGPGPGLSLVVMQVRKREGGRILMMQRGATVRMVGWHGGMQPVRSDWRMSLGLAVAACWSRLRQAYQKHQAIAELKELDDRSLRDIGVARGDIEAIVRYGARRE